MPSVLSMVLAQNAMIDPMTNLGSIINIIEEIGVPPELFERAKTETVATGPVTLCALVSWAWPVPETPAILKASLSLTSPSGRVSVLIEGTEINGPVPTPRCRIVIQIQAFPVDIPGTYVFRMMSDGKELAATPLEIRAATFNSLALQNQQVQQLKPTEAPKSNRKRTPK